mgnify:CR=1 FL=1
MHSRPSPRRNRVICRTSSATGGYGSRPVLPPMEIAGSVDMLGYHWLHIALNPVWQKALLASFWRRAASCRKLI